MQAGVTTELHEEGRSAGCGPLVAVPFFLRGVNFKGRVPFPTANLMDN
jgi:hypothetical protein